nr:HlyD family type I secretion periplasmic adaptor subunit [uncultured Celeribacter sp.]
MDKPEVKTGFRSAVTIGIGGFLVLFFGLLVWASLTDISGAVIAQGMVEVSGKPKTIQHLDGGVVEEIFVVDGQHVEDGDELMRLDDTLLKANLVIYRTRLSEALAQRDRLLSEQRDDSDILFEDVEPMVANTNYELHRIGQREVFQARRELEKGRREQLAEKVAQYNNQIEGVEALIAAKEQQLDLLVADVETTERLASSGLARAPQLSELKRNQADLLGQIAEHRSELARIRNSIRDTELEVLQGQREKKEEVVTQLQEETTQIHELRQQIFSTERQLSRTIVRAPSAGRIHEMQVTTLGGVIAPGATILQIIPSDQGVSFQVRVDPSAVDQVHVGQDAKLRFPAFNSRTTPELTGRVVEVSPTSVLDEMTGLYFFRVSVTASDGELARLEERELVPGMPVEAYLQTGERSVLNYLLKPLQEQLMLAFREE